MERYTIEQRVFIIKNYFKFGESYAEVVRKFRTEYGRENCPSIVVIRKIVLKFVETGTVKDERSKIYHRSGRSEVNIAAVSASVNESPKTSIRHRSQQLHTLITNFLFHELEGMDVQNMWFQQDGAPCHTATETIDLLRERFGNRIISRRGNINWPPRSCDLTPLDYFLWGYVKAKVYANDP